MKLQPNRRLRQSGQALLLCIIAVVIVIIVFGIVLYLFITTIQRVVPPGHDAQGNLLPIGAHYMGGTIIGYTNGGTLSIAAVTNSTFTLLMYADRDAANVITNWQNCRFVKSWTYTGWTLSEAYSDFCPSNRPQESWPFGQAPDRQFYNILISQ